MFSGKRRPGPGEGQALPVGGRASRSGGQARTTVYPCGTCLGPKHLVPDLVQTFNLEPAPRTEKRHG